MLSAAGCDNNHQVGLIATAKCNDRGCVESMKRVPIDITGIQCISGGYYHSVIVKEGKTFATGDDREFSIGSNSRQVYTEFTEVKICEEPISWAACGSSFTICLTVSGRVILCSSKALNDRIEVEMEKKAVSVFAGRYYGAIIDEDGSAHIFDKKDLRKSLTMYTFNSPAVDIVCCENRYSQEFIEIPSLKGKKIIKISGYSDTCAALSYDGHVFFLWK